MKKYQNISFARVEECFEYISHEESQMVFKLRELIFETIPSIKEALSYNVPFYYGRKRICFIWPGSIPWGKVRGKNVMIGFCYGWLLSDDSFYLERGKRKQVYTKTFSEVEDIQVPILKKFLEESANIDGLIR